MDAPTATLENLNDDNLFVTVDSLPIFDCHERTATMKDGKKVKVKVDAARLARILEKMLYLKDKKQQPVMICCGHRHPDPEWPEDKQPPPVGWAIKYRMQDNEEGKPEIVVDYRIARDKFDEWKSYPFRSAEFIPVEFGGDDRLTAVASLRRDPQLDVGATVYSAPRVLYYSLGANMAEETKVDPAAQPDADDDQKTKVASEEDKQDEERFCRYMDKHFKSHLMRYMAGGKAGQAAMWAQTDDADGHQKDKKSGDSSMEGNWHETRQNETPAMTAQREQDALRYQRLDERQKDLEAKQAALEKERDEAIGKACVADLNREGFYFKDAEKEVLRFASLTPAQRTERMEEIRLNYQRDPAAGPMLKLADPTKDKGPDVVTEQHQTKALTYMREHGCEWDEALAKTA